MEDLSNKLRLLKGKVKDWTRIKSLEMRDKSILIEDEIKSLLESTSSGILGARDHSRLLALRHELQIWVDHELQSARLQRKLSWALQVIPIQNSSMRWLQLERTIMLSGVWKMRREIRLSMTWALRP